MKKYIENALTFDGYVELIDRLLVEGKTTGPIQSDSMLGYARINRQRMARIGKTLELESSVRDAVTAIERPMVWLVITEGWCGDAAQNIPAIEKIAAENELIQTLYILRDENIDLMDQFLRRGARSIPKLIALDAETLEILGTWGPRSADAQAYFDDLKAEGFDKLQISELLQRWYNTDRSRSLQADFSKLLPQWSAASDRALVTAQAG